MKSRVIDSRQPVVHASGHLPGSPRLPRLSRAALMLAGAACMLTLSGCYYPYGYYPAGYYPYYATVPASGTQQAVQVGPADATGTPSAQGADSQQSAQQAQQAQQAQTYQQSPPPAYAVAAPPVYVAPVYPAYYPAYPAYYGYPGWYGPSVSIGFGFGGYWGGHGGYWGGHGGGWGHGGHYH
ncbi:hypothetical protein AAGS40_09370 [Paraburkholderia sp. PREW-6R]|uniref:hypothetical protein n=1 Tax=Paraburkholderia sp. PREW-6R TaxID=3141544 RepID=UPI0031F55CD9